MPTSRLTGFPRIRRKFALLCARRWLAIWLLGCCLLGGLASGALAQSSDVINREYPLKALFLFNFASYVEWPPTAVAGENRPFVIGILGSAPLEDTLREIAATKLINGRRIVLEHFASAAALRECQILFIGREVSPQERQLAVEKLWHQPVLIVGESEGFAQHGAVVNFFVENNKIRFEINVDAAREQRLTISSKLLALARIVEPGGGAKR